MQIWLNVTLIRNKYNIPSRPLLPDTIMNKYKILQYLELAYLILSVCSLFQPSKAFNQMASDAKLAWRIDIFRSKDTVIEKVSRL